METPKQKPPGLRTVLGRFGSTILGALRTRVELFALELQEERQRFVQILCWSAAALFFSMAAVITITVAVVWTCPAPARPYVLAGFCLVYLGLALGAGWGLRKRLRIRPPAFSASLGELKKDAACLRPRP